MQTSSILSSLQGGFKSLSASTAPFFHKLYSFPQTLLESGKKLVTASGIHRWNWKVIAPIAIAATAVTGIFLIYKIKTLKNQLTQAHSDFAKLTEAAKPIQDQAVKLRTAEAELVALKTRLSQTEEQAERFKRDGALNRDELTALRDHHKLLQFKLNSTLQDQFGFFIQPFQNELHEQRVSQEKQSAVQLELFQKQIGSLQEERDRLSELLDAKDAQIASLEKTKDGAMKTADRLVRKLYDSSLRRKLSGRGSSHSPTVKKPINGSSRNSLVFED